MHQPMLKYNVIDKISASYSNYLTIHFTLLVAPSHNSLGNTVIFPSFLNGLSHINSTGCRRTLIDIFILFFDASMGTKRLHNNIIQKLYPTKQNNNYLQAFL